MASAAAPADGSGDTRINYNEKTDVFSYDCDTGESNISSMVRQHLQALDREGKGYVTAADLQKAQEAAAAAQPPEKGGKKSGVTFGNAASEDAGGMSVRSSIMRGLGLVGHRVTTNDMRTITEKTRALQEEQKFYRRIFCVLALALVLLSCAMFGVSFAAAELAKETTVDDDGIVRTRSGGTALMGSAEMTVKDGRLVDRSAQATCTNETCTDPGIATRAAEDHRPLNSKYGDAIFESLDRFTIGFTAPDGYTTRVTMKVHSFMRVRSARSIHGTLVKLEVLRGTITLDDTDIHVSDDLARHLETQGLLVSEQDASAFGRRLQTSQATVLGIFGFFDESTFPDLPPDQAPPKSPTPPYIAFLVDRWPCHTEAECTSSLFPGQKLPGYDVETDSILAKYMLLVTENASYTVSQMPNHPLQELILYSDHTTETTVAYQSWAGDVTLCYNATYEPPIPLHTDGYYMSYLGEVQRAEKEIMLIGEKVTLPSSTNRLFRIQSENVSEEEDWYEYEDDSTTLAPRRMGLPFARERDMLIEETFVLESYEITPELAEYLLANLSADFGITTGSDDWHAELMNCTDSRNAEAFDVPSMHSPMTETLDSVLYYVLELQEAPSSGAKNMEYWQEAEQVVDRVFVENERAKAIKVPLVNTTPEVPPDEYEEDDYSNATNESRRLTMRAKYLNFDFNLPLSQAIPGFPDIDYSIAQSPDDPEDMCWTVGVMKEGKFETKDRMLTRWASKFSVPGWGASGSVSWGRWCVPGGPSAFTVSGDARIWFSFKQRWGWTKRNGDFVGLSAEFQIGAGFSIHYWKHGFDVSGWGFSAPACPMYSYARRLEEDSELELLEWDSSEEAGEEEMDAEARRLPPNLPWGDHNAPTTRRRTDRRRAGEPDFSFPHRRRGKKEATHTRRCLQDVIRVDMLIYASGSIDLFGMFGASIYGHLRFRMGPMAIGAGQAEFLDRGIDSRLVVDGEFMACARILFIRPCWKIRKDIANVNI
mmetsp:Transcript_30065/g.54828  ORF Transcript_30065/g.54828 Transcript_30065/m.54828 type:complete len:992 (-) Transcript_30065:257-3232(-)